MRNPIKRCTDTSSLHYTITRAVLQGFSLLLQSVLVDINAG